VLFQNGGEEVGPEMWVVPESINHNMWI
jgi:hypothetical protein